MTDNNNPKHRLIIQEIGKPHPDGIIVEVHSRGGSLFGLKSIIDEVSERQLLNIKTVYDNKIGAGHLAVIFSHDNGEDASDKLDRHVESKDDMDIQGYFCDAVCAAYAIAEEKKQS